MSSRLKALVIGFSLVWLIVLLRAAHLQLVPDERLTKMRERQFQTNVTLQSRRGAILDRSGRELAMSMRTYSLFADPSILKARKTLARRLSRELSLPRENLESRFKDRQKRFVWIARHLSKEKADSILAWEVEGIGVVQEFKRVFPNDELAAQTLGFTGLEGQGLEGIELQYEEMLRGGKKRVSLRRDARGRLLLAEGLVFMENPDGAEIYLTLDADIQHTLETELAKAVEEFDADQAFGLVLDAQTSAILAQATAPFVSANMGAKSSPELRRNKVITDVFEPGSVMKTFALAAALDKGIVRPNTKINTENGSLRVGDRVIREAEMDHKWSELTVSEILAVSSNIGTTKIAFQLGADVLRDYLSGFGFGHRTGVDFPGEAKGTLQNLPWNQHLLSNISFGHGVASSALQIANAYAAIANGGILRRPYLVQKIKEVETGSEIVFKSEEIRRVISKETSDQLRLMLAGVTAPGGTGVNAKVNSFVVGGKTGTAQKADLIKGGYKAGAYLSSFVGFIPAADPRFVILIAVDHPRRNSYYGSQVAAPVFSKVASYAARKEGLVPTLISKKNLVERSAGPLTSRRQKIESDETSPIMPNLLSLSMREVLQTFRGQEFDVQIRGRGTVVRTYPEEGVSLRDKQRIVIELK